MITTEVFGPDENRPFRRIHFRGEKGSIIRRVWLDQDGVIVRDYLYESDAKGRRMGAVMYGCDYEKVLAILEYLRDEKDREYAIIQYKVCNGEKIRIQKVETIFDEDGHVAKDYLYGEADEPVGYALYAYQGSDDPAAPKGIFNMRGERISYKDLGLEQIF